MKHYQNTSIHMKFAALVVAFGFLNLSNGSAFAASCQQKAASMAAAQKAQVLSVQAKGNSCKIKLLIKPPKGPPKRKTIVVRK